MSEFVVIDEDGRFLSGPRKWSHEFPDARLFYERAQAIAAARHTKVLCEVVEDYGVETQRTIETVG